VRKRVYCACPISKPDTPTGLLHNVKQADAAMLELLKAGYSPFNPALTVFVGGATVIDRRYTSVTGFYAVVGATADRQANGGFKELSHADWLDMDFAWVAVSDAVLRLPGESVGADKEVEHARKLGIPVFTDIPALRAYFESEPVPALLLRTVAGEGTAT
jgi:hypothetical protein